MVDKITIIYASDENFLPQTYVSIYSVLEARKCNCWFDFFILVPAGINKVLYDKQWDFSYYEIHYIEIDNDLFDEEEMKIVHITKPTYYRLLIPRLFPNIDKCIYLDGDTICESDIIELYMEDIEKYYLGGCKWETINFCQEQLNSIAQRLKVPCVDEYINVGILLLNLAKLREIQEILLLECKNGYALQDQDVINKCCYGKIKILHMKYNVCSYAYNMKKRNQLFQNDDIVVDEALNKPCIIHLVSEYAKPWRNDKCIFYDEWWHIAKKALPSDILLKLKNKTRKIMREFSYERLFDKIDNATSIVIFGFSKVGFEFEKIIYEKYGKEKIKCFCDNDIEKWNKEIDGYRVCRPEELLEFQDSCFIVVTSQKYFVTIINQLLNMGINKELIGVYRKKSNNYYFCLNEELFDTISINQL